MDDGRCGKVPEAVASVDLSWQTKFSSGGLQVEVV
jgi:hypothetical protein